MSLMSRPIFFPPLLLTRKSDPDPTAPEHPQPPLPPGPVIKNIASQPSPNWPPKPKLSLTRQASQPDPNWPPKPKLSLNRQASQPDPNWPPKAKLSLSQPDPDWPPPPEDPRLPGSNPVGPPDDVFPDYLSWRMLKHDALAICEGISYLMPKVR